jgi:hypothetical protein
VLNWAHLHLLVNDVPILADVFAALFFGLAFMREVERRTWVRAGWILLAIGSFGALSAFFTGEPALRVIDGEPHTSGRALSQHHVRALVAIGAASVAAIVGVVAMVLARRSGGIPSQRLLVILFVVTLGSAATLGWTGLAGGRIGHPELQLPGDRDAGPARPH